MRQPGMNRTVALAVGVVLVAGSCGGSTAGTSTSVVSGETGTFSASSTATPVPTSAPTATAGIDPIIEAARATVGEYAGEWTNTTFGSTGPMTASIDVADDGTVTLAMDLGGLVFGESDPDPEVLTFGALDVIQGVDVESAVFGTVTLKQSLGGLTMSARDVPSSRIGSVQIIVTLGRDGTVSGTYEIIFEGETAVGAEGVFALTRR
ncbi:hypothetical protein MNBD_ACTINO02-365 [hydrothermal vent metagenome]|uniref:Lipoprotein n=1 Tax=hydrothermal vent metagenome TaxID=652676 RepID=A0A3B0STT4_9ZZZZ